MGQTARFQQTKGMAMIVKTEGGASGEPRRAGIR